MVAQLDVAVVQERVLSNVLVVVLETVKMDAADVKVIAEAVVRHVLMVVDQVVLAPVEVVVLMVVDQVVLRHVDQRVLHHVLDAHLPVPVVVLSLQHQFKKERGLNGI